ALLGPPLQRAVRDACVRSEKEARLDLAGGDAQIDRRLLEALQNPLLHLVRNAVDHGIEPAAVREAVGKPPRGVITVSVEQRARDVVITVADDGRGIDVAQVKNKAVERGLYSDAEAEKLSLQESYDLLFRGGFTTAETVT